MRELTAALYNAFDTDPAPIVEFLAWLAASEGLPVRPRVLDVGCGTGRLLGPLAGRGWRIVGLEPDADYRAHATESARGLTGVEIRPGGFGDIAEEATYDLIIGINSAFSHLLSVRSRADALVRCRRALRPGGILFLDLPNLLRVFLEWRGPSVLEANRDGRQIRLERQHEVDFQAATFTTHETYAVREADGSEWNYRRDHPYAITTFPELADLFQRAGFDSLRTFTSYEARAPELLGSGRMLIEAKAEHQTGAQPPG